MPVNEQPPRNALGPVRWIIPVIALVIAIARSVLVFGRGARDGDLGIMIGVFVIGIALALLLIVMLTRPSRRLVAAQADREPAGVFAQSLRSARMVPALSALGVPRRTDLPSYLVVGVAPSGISVWSTRRTNDCSSRSRGSTSLLSASALPRTGSRSLPM